MLCLQQNPIKGINEHHKASMEANRFFSVICAKKTFQKLFSNKLEVSKYNFLVVQSQI